MKRMITLVGKKDTFLNNTDYDVSLQNSEGRHLRWLAAASVYAPQETVTLFLDVNDETTCRHYLNQGYPSNE